MIKTKRNRKWKSYKNHKLKVKLMSWSSLKKKRAFFVPFILSKGNLINICVLPHYFVCWIHFLNIHNFLYQKKFLHILFCSFLQSSKAFSVSLIKFNKVATLLKRKLWHRCFSVNFGKFLKRPFLQNISGRLFLKKSVEESGVTLC